MIGAIAGDIIGSVYEHHNIKTKDFVLFSDRCFFTDDSILTIALADSILTGTPYVENLKSFYHWYPDGGYGGSFHRWAQSPSSGPYNSWGNGAAMRISPVGYAYNDLDTILQKAKEFTEITHNHPEGIKGAQATAAAIFLARTGESKTVIKEFIESKFHYDLSKHVDEIRPTYQFDESSQGTVPQALRAFIDSCDFEDAIRTAVSLGGDTDTIACITGGVAQAFYGAVPETIQQKVYSILDGRLGQITRKFMDRYCGKSSPNNQFCPICSRPVSPNPRYPRYACRECAAKASSQDGRALTFFNLSIGGGYGAQYTDTGEQYLSQDCNIDGVKCFADEARFGGIVIQAVVNFKEDLNQRYWEYQKSRFQIFERPYALDGRPPVFLTRDSWRNIIINPEASDREVDKLLALVPEGEKHKWYRSMNSSQALAQSVLGNLAVYGSLHHLSELKDDEGLDLFGKAQVSSENFAMEFRVKYLGEPRSTSLDGYISGDYRVAIECKFTEAEVGTCSRPGLKPTALTYKREYCNGTYSFQRARKERCSLTEIGVLYWWYLPKLFKWKYDSDLFPCPLHKNYQLIRNILSIGVKPDGSVSLNDGHSLLIYDERNPAFQHGGLGLIAYMKTKEALQEPTMLRKCSWQRIVQHLREKDVLPWLTENLNLKYGL
jgi:ADP-ribosylglycohydrolase